MKKILIVLALAVISSQAKASTTTSAQSVREVVTNLLTCSSTTFTTSVSEISGNTAVSSTTYAAYAISVLNLNTANVIYCSDNSAVTASGNNIGWPIGPTSGTTGPWNWQLWAISMTQKWYCIANAVNTQALVCRWK